MSVPTELIRATRPHWDTEDLAFLYMEEEVGRFDWRNNWLARKSKGDVRAQVQAWLDDIKVQHNPDEIIAYLDKMVEHRTGSWV